VSLAPLAAAKLGGVLPIGFAGFAGISYLTFRAVDALVAVQDGRVVAFDARAFLAYVLFPPTVSAGPIDRFQRFAQDFRARRPRAEWLADVDAGVERLFVGLAQKFVLAALVDDLAVSRLADDPRPASTLAYMYAYSVYLYFDFAGYSAIAVGVSRLFGVRTPENFDRPYLATDIGDFWNRWHVSLSSWLRDHVYLRVTFAALRRHWFGGDRYAASALAFLATFGLMGAWHGLAPRYVVYGLYHAVLAIGHQNVARWARARPPLASSRGWAWAGRVATLQAVCFGFLIFSGRLGG
jgi:membrane protein involved in D-alanine export